jgi:hypothetical protein
MLLFLRKNLSRKLLLASKNSDCRLEDFIPAIFSQFDLDIARVFTLKKGLLTLKKRLSIFPSPAVRSLTKLSLNRNNRESLVSDFTAGDGEIDNLFYIVNIK